MLSCSHTQHPHALSEGRITTAQKKSGNFLHLLLQMYLFTAHVNEFQYDLSWVIIYQTNVPGVASFCVIMKFCCWVNTKQLYFSIRCYLWVTPISTWNDLRGREWIRRVSDVVRLTCNQGSNMFLTSDVYEQLTKTGRRPRWPWHTQVLGFHYPWLHCPSWRQTSRMRFFLQTATDKRQRARVSVL